MTQTHQEPTGKKSIWIPQGKKLYIAEDVPSLY